MEHAPRMAEVSGEPSGEVSRDRYPFSRREGVNMDADQKATVDRLIADPNLTDEEFEARFNELGITPADYLVTLSEERQKDLLTKLAREKPELKLG
jgi:hypothetical protein